MTLKLDAVSAGYGGVDVIHDIDLVVRPREIVTLVGNNGAGKSTLVKAISGLLPVRAGSISFEEKRIDGWSTAARIRSGIVHVPEGRQIFSGFSIAENLQLGGYLHTSRRSDATTRQQEVWRLFPLLRERASTLAGNLSGGQQQMLAIGRGLMAEPKLLMLDEPSLGLAPRVVSEIFDLIVRLREQGLAILLSEQNARLSLDIADRGYVVENGRVVLTGSGQELLRSQEVADRYLGVGVELEGQSGDRRDELVGRLRDLSQPGMQSQNVYKKG
jgi:branched-chain amino acid transport system ATP-binding protein